MAEYVEKEAKSVEEAVQLALEELQAEMEDVEVEVLEEGTKAVIGLFGGKDAKVRVTRKVSSLDVVNAFLTKLTETAGIDATFQMSEKDDVIDVKILGDDVGALIGRHGDTLTALQYLANLMVNRSKENHYKVYIDIEDYKENRKAKLESIARRTADKVMNSKRAISMDPMSAYERKIVHSALQGYTQLETVSYGEEPGRYIVIKYKG